MPARKRQPPQQSGRATRQSARLRGNAEGENPGVHGEETAVAPHKSALASGPSASKRPQSKGFGPEVRSRPKPDHGIPQVYNEMLAEALAEEEQAGPSLRPSKRRKLSEEPSSMIGLDIDLFGEPVAGENVTAEETANDRARHLQQIVLNDFDVDDESEVEFEDVDLEPAAEEYDYDDEPESKTLELNLAAVTPRRAAPKRKPVSFAERKLRLDAHKAHIVMLLAHLRWRNYWCNDESVHALLKPLIPQRVASLLHVSESKSQYERNNSFMKGIEEVCTTWREQWTIDQRGMIRAHWREDVDPIKESDDAEDLDFDDFKSAAASRKGSRDLAAELFCALLRSVAVEARLVCSLQVLPFSGVAKGQTPEKPKAQYIRAPPQNYNSTQGSSAQKRKVYSESTYPIFWVEAFSPAIQTWIPLDPIVRNTINKPKTGFEPPSADIYNQMIYVVAFEDDGSAKDVTKRYTQLYNSKLRKQRVESTPSGEKWWNKTMTLLEKPFREDRDDIEDAFFQKRIESEPMPGNIQDFKGHSIYVLERHLRINEVIHPRREAGKVSIRVAKNAKLESVFRRQDVHLCRTADAWYRRGRDVNEGEQPLKRVVPKGKKAAAPDEFDDNDDEEATEGTALYAEFQTSLYEPPPVVGDKIPRNAYGNLDVYVPTMIPAGGVHIRHPLAAKAARVLGIDYADAVTGFQFKGRQGTAVIDGVVVAMKMTHATITVIEGLESQASEEAEEARSKIVLALWKRWLTALRVREHVQQRYGDREEDKKTRMVDADEDDDDMYRPEEDGGGFMLDSEGFEPDQSDEDAVVDTTSSKLRDLRPLDQLLPPELVHQEIIVVRSPHKLPLIIAQDPPEQPGSSNIAANAGGFLDEETEAGGFIPEDEGNSQQPRPNTLPAEPAIARPEEIDEEGGGFFAEEDEAGGGFLPEEAEQDTEGIDGPAPASKSISDQDTTVAAAQKADEPTVQSQTSTHAPTRPEQPVSEQRDKADKGSPGSIASSGSRLSHDPEEDDAEPEWLLNSLGEID